MDLSILEIEDLLELAYKYEIEIDEEDTKESIIDKLYYFQEPELFEEFVPKENPFEEILKPLSYGLAQFSSTRDYFNFSLMNSKIYKICHSYGTWKVILDRKFKMDYKGKDPEKDGPIIQMIYKWKKQLQEKDWRERTKAYWKTFEIIFYGISNPVLNIYVLQRGYKTERDIPIIRLISLLQSLNDEELECFKKIYDHLHKKIEFYSGYIEGRFGSTDNQRGEIVKKLRDLLMLDEKSYEKIKSTTFQLEFFEENRKVQTEGENMDAVFEYVSKKIEPYSIDDIILNNIY